ncbi:hypothetical protein [Sporosarcina beigongshangi]|uniref:hypothetical protein n=1 Tax=Sporosarcina beigongshangi TaxID=2782538 RepID=UPI001939B605|nr:hypothetical protein [Sporosarcina beigongshangi]
MKKKKRYEERTGNFKLYFSPFFRESYTRIYDVLLDTHDRTYDAIYKEVKENPEKAYERCLKEAEETIIGKYSFNPEYDDMGDYYEKVQDYAVDRMQEQSLMHYQFVLMSLSNLYQVFEQQLRRWLHEEMTHRHNEYLNQIEFTSKHEEEAYGKFVNNFGILGGVLKEMNLTFTMLSFSESEILDWFGHSEDSGIEVPIVETEIWETIRECNLISNTFKHGSGTSAKALFEIRPEYFEKVGDTKLMNLYRTTNMEEVLSVDNISFEKYAMAMKAFWEKLKEHQNGSINLKIDISMEDGAQAKK